jgi:hypothetical protein
MKFPILLITLLIFFTVTKSQSIIAGQHGAKDYYKDFNPDTVIYCNSMASCHHKEIPIDLNGDGINDIKFITNNSSGAMGGGDDYVLVKADSNNQVASGTIDSCGHTLGKAFFNFDTIQFSDTWSNEELDLKRETWMAGFYSCYASASTLSSYFIGTRFFAYNDTLYGWIQINNIYIDSWDAHFTIQEYACNKGSVGLNEYGNDNFLHVFPNPCKDIISIELESPARHALGILSDINGKELIKQPLDSKKSQLDVSSLARGIYFLRVFNEKAVSVLKIIVE